MKQKPKNSQAGFIYTQGNREDERKSCVHTFCTLIGRSSDAGTSYCTEAMCGEILFGEGTTVDVSMALRVTFLTYLIWRAHFD